jgi:hypothetical protein
MDFDKGTFLQIVGAYSGHHDDLRDEKDRLTDKWFQDSDSEDSSYHYVLKVEFNSVLFRNSNAKVRSPFIKCI